MKRVIPFTKDISFNTSIYEICSISLEHTLKSNKNNEIKGEFIISGEYKVSDSVLNNEPFIFNIPFYIDLDTKYDLDKIKIDIDDFNYDLENSDCLKVNINISIDGIEEKKEDEYDKDMIEKIETIYDIKDEKEDKEEIRNNEDLFKEEKNEENVVPIIKEEEVTSIFNSFDNKDDKFVTYHVHIFREKDDINNIIKTYNTTKEELEEYNDLDKITLGSKIIIPCNEQI